MSKLLQYWRPIAACLVVLFVLVGLVYGEQLSLRPEFLKPLIYSNALALLGLLLYAMLAKQKWQLTVVGKDDYGRVAQSVHRIDEDAPVLNKDRFLNYLVEATRAKMREVTERNNRKKFIDALRTNLLKVLSDHDKAKLRSQALKGDEEVAKLVEVVLARLQESKAQVGLLQALLPECKELPQSTDELTGLVSNRITHVKSVEEDRRVLGDLGRAIEESVAPQTKIDWNQAIFTAHGGIGLEAFSSLLDGLKALLAKAKKADELSAKLDTANKRAIDLNDQLRQAQADKQTLEGNETTLRRNLEASRKRFSELEKEHNETQSKYRNASSQLDIFWRHLHGKFAQLRARTSMGNTLHIDISGAASEAFPVQWTQILDQVVAAVIREMENQQRNMVEKVQVLEGKQAQVVASEIEQSPRVQQLLAEVDSLSAESDESNRLASELKLQLETALSEVKSHKEQAGAEVQAIKLELQRLQNEYERIHLQLDENQKEVTKWRKAASYDQERAETAIKERDAALSTKKEWIKEKNRLLLALSEEGKKMSDLVAAESKLKLRYSQLQTEYEKFQAEVSEELEAVEDVSTNLSNLVQLEFGFALFVMCHTLRRLHEGKEGYGDPKAAESIWKKSVARLEEELPDWVGSIDNLMSTPKEPFVEIGHWVQTNLRQLPQIAAAAFRAPFDDKGELVTVLSDILTPKSQFGFGAFLANESYAGDSSWAVPLFKEETSPELLREEVEA